MIEIHNPPQQLSPRFAVCINNTDYPASLERHIIACSREN